MSINSNSYGSVAEVAALTPRYLIGGTFVDPATTPTVIVGTRPTLTQVEKWIDNASSTLNVLLANAGFAIPITQADAKAACGQLIAEVVSDLVHAANSSGRFYTDRALESGIAPMKVLRKDMQEWVDAMASGLILLGVSKTQLVHINCSVANPQFERTILENNSEAENIDEIGTLI